MPTQAVYYRSRDGHQPVKDFLDETFPLVPAGRNPTTKQIERSARRRAMIDLQIDRLNGLADDLPPLEFPITSQVKGGLRELRCHAGSQLYRVLYRRSDNLFILLHMFYKNRGAIQEADIEIAERRWRDFKARMDAERRRPPRAAGTDAPRRKGRDGGSGSV